MREPDADLRELIESLPAFDRAYLLEPLTSPSDARAREIGAWYGSALAPATVELLIDLEEDRAARALVVGMLREVQRDSTPP